MSLWSSDMLICAGTGWTRKLKSAKSCPSSSMESGSLSLAGRQNVMGSVIDSTIAASQSAQAKTRHADRWTLHESVRVRTWLQSTNR